MISATTMVIDNTIPSQTLDTQLKEKTYSTVSIVFATGLETLQEYMNKLSLWAAGFHKEMTVQGKNASEAQQNMASIDALIANIDLDDKHNTVKLGTTLYNYMLNHPELRKDTGWVDGTGSNWKKSELVKMKGNVQKYITQNSDAMSQSQLQVQRIMQTYNVTVSLMNSLQTMMGDLNKMFAQGIR